MTIQIILWRNQILPQSTSLSRLTTVCIRAGKKITTHVKDPEVPVLKSSVDHGNTKITPARTKSVRDFKMLKLDTLGKKSGNSKLTFLTRQLSWQRTWWKMKLNDPRRLVL